VNTGPVIPLWLGIPVAAMLMLVVAAHALSLGESDHPASRKRIRQSNAVMILLAIPLLTCGFCVLDPQAHPREWALVWLACFALLGFVVLLAVADMLNTLRLGRAERGRARSSLWAPVARRPGDVDNAPEEPYEER